MREYPYQQSLKALQNESITLPEFGALDGDVDPYKAIVVLTGAIIRKGTPKQKALLISSLQNSKQATPLEIGTAPSTVDTGVVNPLREWMPPQANGVAAAEIARYTMAIGEYAVREGIEAKYNYQQMSHDPPVFKVTLHVKGFTFEGKAKTKKTAKHVASKDACEFLKIKLI